MKTKQLIGLEDVREILAATLVDVQTYLASLGCPMKFLSLIARDPMDDEMFLLVTNETDDGLEKAFNLSRQRIQDGPWKPS